MYRDQNPLKRIHLEEFLERNERPLILLGIFLTAFSISYSHINKINSTYAGYLSLIICGISFLLISEMIAKEKEQLSIMAAMFLLGVIGILVILFLVTRSIYINEYQNSINFLFGIGSIFIGALIGIKLFTYIEKFERNFWIDLDIFILSIFIVNFLIGPIYELINSFLGSWEYRPLIIFGAGAFSWVTITWGLFEGGKGIIKPFLKKFSKIR